MNKTYPDGAFKSYDELSKYCERALLADVYQASKRFKLVRGYSLLSLTVAKLMDSNIPVNRHNDWFLFADEADAKVYARSEIDG